MISKKQLIIRKYLLMVEQLRKILNVDIFPEFYDVVDILFYFQLNSIIQHIIIYLLVLKYLKIIIYQ